MARIKLTDPAGIAVKRGELCRLCGKATGCSFHHLVPRSQQGDDIPDNGVMLCGDGTRGCHGRVEHSLQARHELRQKLRPIEVAYCIWRLSDDGRLDPDVGRGRLERRYPKLDPQLSCETRGNDVC